MTKDERQAIGIEAFKNSKDFGSDAPGRGTLCWPTGMGKTYTGCVIINKILSTFAEGDVLVLVPFTNLADAWQDEVNKRVEQKHRVIVMTVQLYCMHQYYMKPILLILDELDEFYSEERIKIIKRVTCPYKFCLGLTATFKEKQKRHVVVEQYLPIIDYISEEEALENGWISDFIQFNLAVDLTTDESDLYRNYTAKISACLGKFGGSYPAAMSMLIGNKDTGETPFTVATKYAMSMGWRNNLDLTKEVNREIAAQWSPNLIIGYAKLLNDSIKLRGDLLNLCQAKYDAVIKIVGKFELQKGIIFSQSVKFADKIQGILNSKFSNKDNLFDSNYPYCVLYHSSMVATMVHDTTKNKQVKMGPTRLKRHYLSLVKNGFSKKIATARALDKGLDIPDIEIAIITSANSTKSKQKQREGRAKRITDLLENKKAIIVNVYCRGTSDENNLRERQRDSLQSKIHYIDSVDDIGLEFKNKNKITYRI